MQGSTLSALQRHAASGAKPLPMNAILEPASCSERIARDLDQQRQRGALRQIVIPPCPDELIRLRQALQSAEPDLNEVARIATGDVAMAATLLRNANAAVNAVGPPVQTVGAALDRLGLHQSAALMTAFLVRQALPVSSRHLERFWQRSSKRALAMGHLARQLPGLSPDLAATFGLFAHVGIPVLLQSVKGYGGTLVEAQARIDRSFIATENANHRTDHAVAGALLARAWKLAPSVVTAIALHHEFGQLGSRGAEPEVHTLVAAGLVAEYPMRRREGLSAEVDWLQHGAAALAWLHAGADELTLWEEALLPVLDEQ